MDSRYILTLALALVFASQLLIVGVVYSFLYWGGFS